MRPHPGRRSTYRQLRCVLIPVDDPRKAARADRARHVLLGECVGQAEHTDFIAYLLQKCSAAVTVVRTKKYHGDALLREFGMGDDHAQDARLLAEMYLTLVRAEIRQRAENARTLAYDRYGLRKRPYRCPGILHPSTEVVLDEEMVLRLTTLLFRCDADHLYTAANHPIHRMRKRRKQNYFRPVSEIRAVSGGGDASVDDWLTPRTVAVMIGRTPRWVNALCAAGRLRSVDTPTGKRIDPDSVAALQAAWAADPPRRGRKPKVRAAAA